MGKYQSYKSSGIEWIGEIPSHWDFIKTNILTYNLDGKRVPLNSEERGEMEGEYPYWGSNGIIDYVNQFIFNEEIVLVGEDGSPFFDKFKDVSFYVNEPVWVNNHIHILKPKERILPKYLTHSFNCVDYKEYITGSTRDKLTQSDLKRISHCVPPLNEQLQIVQFLDDKTDLIDKLISTKERKITLLKEQRISLINQVVTKGLNPNVKMKDSGVEWIGEIPEGWMVTRIGFVSELLTGNPWKSDLFNFDEGLKIVRGENVSEGFLRWGDRTRFWKHEVIKGDTYFLNEGDIIISMDGSKVGKNYVLINQNELPLLLHQRMCRVRCKDICSPKFLNYFVGSQMFRYYIDITKTDPMIPHITQKDISNFILPLPSIEEQFEITEYLYSKTKEIDDLVQLEQKKINLLKEYRQSLISEVVTGKIKVTTDE